MQLPWARYSSRYFQANRLLKQSRKVTVLMHEQRQVLNKKLNKEQRLGLACILLKLLPTRFVQQSMFLRIFGTCNRVAIPYDGQWFPCGYTSIFPFDLDVVARSVIFSISSLQWTFMVDNTTKREYFVFDKLNLRFTAIASG